MKKILFFSILFCVFLLNTASTCCDDDTIAIVAVAKSPDIIRNTLNQGSWKVTYFLDARTNKTSSFLGYFFTFVSNEILIASTTSSDFTGNWFVAKSSIGDDDSKKDINFTISFSSPTAFVELSNDWKVVDITATELRLRGLNSSTGETNYVTFERN
jgi:hypothetical protein